MNAPILYFWLVKNKNGIHKDSSEWFGDLAQKFKVRWFKRGI